MEAPILQGPNLKILFHIHFDASDKKIDEVLGKKEKNIPYFIYYISKKLIKPKLNYFVTET